MTHGGVDESSIPLGVLAKMLREMLAHTVKARADSTSTSTSTDEATNAQFATGAQAKSATDKAHSAPSQQQQQQQQQQQAPGAAATTAAATLPVDSAAPVSASSTAAAAPASAPASTGGATGGSSNQAASLAAELAAELSNLLAVAAAGADANANAGAGAGAEGVAPSDALLRLLTVAQRHEEQQRTGKGGEASSGRGGAGDDSDLPPVYDEHGQEIFEVELDGEHRAMTAPELRAFLRRANQGVHPDQQLQVEFLDEHDFVEGDEHHLDHHDDADLPPLTEEDVQEERRKAGLH